MLIRRHAGSLAYSLAPLAAAVLLAGCEAGVNADISIPAGSGSKGAAVINGSIEVAPGARVDGDLSIVNGPISVGSEAQVGDINTVNGAVTLRAGARVRGANVVNGDVRLEEKAVVTGSLELVQGDVRLAPGAEISGGVTTVGGSIELRDARIGGDVSTVTADITLNGASVVAGRIVIENRAGTSGSLPRIVIGPGSRVQGVLEFDDPAEVYVSENAQIGGVEGALSEDEIVRFAGPEPEPR